MNNFEINQSRFSGKAGKTKFTKASVASAANPLMTLDFFEGSGVGGDALQG